MVMREVKMRRVNWSNIFRGEQKIEITWPVVCKLSSTMYGTGRESENIKYVLLNYEKEGAKR